MLKDIMLDCVVGVPASTPHINGFLEAVLVQEISANARLHLRLYNAKPKVLMWEHEDLVCDGVWLPRCLTHANGDEFYSFAPASFPVNGSMIVEIDGKEHDNCKCVLRLAVDRPPEKKNNEHIMQKLSGLHEMLQRIYQKN